MSYDMPTLEAQCSTCKHRLGTHYTTHDEKMDGCGYYIFGGGDMRESWPASKCMCKGFTYTYRPPKRTNNDESIFGQPGGGKVQQQWDR